ncbi:MAG: PorV/PorQ family protein, partial [Rhodothermia bacterium]
KVATSSAQFLKLGVGSRAISLGGSFVATASDLSALYWNPAGLSNLTGSAVQLAYTQYLADVNYSYFAFGTSFGSFGTVGFSLIMLDSGTMTVRTINNPTGTGEEFNAQDFSAQMSYGKALTDRFSIGLSAKYIRQSIWHSAASAFAFDIGSLFITPYERLRFGASISNFGANMSITGRDVLFSEDPDPVNQGNVEIVTAAFDTQSFPLPLLFRFGLSWDALILADHSITFQTDAAHPNDNSEYVNLGAEYDFRDLIALRVGYRNLFEVDGEQGLTFGGGLNIRLDRSLSAKFDYAYADFGRLSQTHWFTVGLSF